MDRALHMILVNTIKKLRDSGGWHLAAMAQDMRSAENTIPEKCLDHKVRGSPRIIQVVNQKLEPLMDKVASTNTAVPKEAPAATGFN